MLNVYFAALALTGVPTTDAVPTDFVAYRVEPRLGNAAPGGEHEYIVHTPFNSVRRPWNGTVVAPTLDGTTLKVQMAPLAGPWALPVVDEFRFDRGRIHLVRERRPAVPLPMVPE